MIIDIIAFILKTIVAIAFLVAFAGGFVAWLERVNIRSEQRRARLERNQDTTVDFEEELALPRFAAFVGLLWEGIINAVIYLTMPLGLSDRDPQSKFEIADDQEPLLLVHGYAMNRACWNYLKWRLKQDGHTNIFSINLPLLGKIEDHAEQLNRRIDEVLALTGAKTLTLIAHSQGSLVCRQQMQVVAPGKVHRLITIGAIHEGTKLGPVALGPSSEQITYRSRFVRELNDNLHNLPDSVDLICIGSRHDNLVIPYTSAILDGYDRSDNVLLEYLGHSTLLFSSQVYDQIKRRIS